MNEKQKALVGKWVKSMNTDELVMLCERAEAMERAIKKQCRECFHDLSPGCEDMGLNHLCAFHSYGFWKEA